MGNQGMTNWKLTRIVCYQLDADCRSVHQRRDRTRRLRNGICNMESCTVGADTSTVLAAAFRDNDVLYEYNSTVNSAGTDDGTLEFPLPAGSRENQVMFSYRVDDKHGRRTG